MDEGNTLRPFKEAETVRATWQLFPLAVFAHCFFFQISFKVLCQCMVEKLNSRGACRSTFTARERKKDLQSKGCQRPLIYLISILQYFGKGHCCLCTWVAWQQAALFHTPFEATVRYFNAVQLKQFWIWKLISSVSC